jgi:hypothetical protein
MIDINIKKISFLLNYSTNQAYNKKNNYQPTIKIKINIALNGLLLCVETSYALKKNIICTI